MALLTECAWRWGGVQRAESAAAGPSTRLWRRRAACGRWRSTSAAARCRRWGTGRAPAQRSACCSSCRLLLRRDQRCRRQLRPRTMARGCRATDPALRLGPHRRLCRHPAQRPALPRRCPPDGTPGTSPQLCAATWAFLMASLLRHRGSSEPRGGAELPQPRECRSLFAVAKCALSETLQCGPGTTSSCFQGHRSQLYILNTNNSLAQLQ